MIKIDTKAFLAWCAANEYSPMDLPKSRDAYLAATRTGSTGRKNEARVVTILAIGKDQESGADVFRRASAPYRNRVLAGKILEAEMMDFQPVRFFVADELSLDSDE